jgi:protein ImuB
MTRTIAVVFPEWEHRHGHEGPHRRMQLFEPVVRAMTAVSALVEVEAPGTVLMAARGPARYFGGEEAVAARLWSICAAVDGGAFGVGIADTRFAALAAAHLSAGAWAPRIVAAGATRAFLDPLDPRALSHVGTVSDGTVGLLSRLGMRCCGDVRALGEVSLIERFGIEGRVIADLVSAREVRLFAGGAGEADLSRTVDFEPALSSHHEVVAATRECATAVLEAVAATGRRCVRLLVECGTGTGPSMSRIWAEQRGFTLATVLERLSCLLEGWMVPHDDDGVWTGVEHVRLVPLECREVGATQAVLWGGHEENIERVVRTLSVVMAQGVGVRASVPRWQGGRDVHEAYTWVPVHTVDLVDAAASSKRVGNDHGAVRTWRGALPAPWPAWVPARAAQVRVLDVDGAHVGVTGRHEFTATPASILVGDDHMVVERVAGPWPVEERWWDPRRARRHVRAQLLVRTARDSPVVLLVSLENNTWKLMARYD